MTLDLDYPGKLTQHRVHRDLSDPTPISGSDRLDSPAHPTCAGDITPAAIEHATEPPVADVPPCVAAEAAAGRPP